MAARTTNGVGSARFSTRVLDVSRRIVGAVTGLTWVTAGYGWFTIAAPILVAAPAYFFSKMTFGELMMIVGAFNQVQTALRWFVDNFSSIADWRATLLRVASFRKAILAMDVLGHATSRIDFEEGDRRIDPARETSRRGAGRLHQARRTDGSSSTPGNGCSSPARPAKSRALFFRAIGGLWPWGSGRITHPARRAHHVRAGPGLCAARPIARALSPTRMPRDKFDATAIDKAIGAVGLGHLTAPRKVPSDGTEWLTDEEKQRASFRARYPAKAAMGRDP